MADRWDGGDTDADIRAVDSVAVTVDDVITALEANLRSDRRVVLRITPPFSARMRARLHRPTGSKGDDAVHLDPASLVVDPPTYPDPDETRVDDEGEYAPERHHERHTAAVRAWRESVRETVADAVDVPTGDGTHRIEIKPLG